MQRTSKVQVGIRSIVRKAIVASCCSYNSFIFLHPNTILKTYFQNLPLPFLFLQKKEECNDEDVKAAAREFLYHQAQALHYKAKIPIAKVVRLNASFAYKEESLYIGTDGTAKHTIRTFEGADKLTTEAQNDHRKLLSRLSQELGTKKSEQDVSTKALPLQTGSPEEIAKEIAKIKARSGSIKELTSQVATLEATSELQIEALYTQEESLLSPVQPKKVVSSGTDNFVVPAFKTRKGVLYATTTQLLGGESTFNIWEKDKKGVFFSIDLPAGTSNKSMKGCSVSIKDNILTIIAGGGPEPTQVLQFNTEDRSFSFGPSPEPYIPYSKLVFLDEYLYCLGGGSSTKVFRRPFKKLHSKWKEVAPMSEPYSSFLPVACGTSIYVLGGFECGSYVRNMQKYNPEENKWEVLDARLPDNFNGATAFEYKGKIIVAGGVQPQRRVYSFNPNTSRWVRQDPLDSPIARGWAYKNQHGKPVIVLRNQTLCFHGNYWTTEHSTPSFSRSTTVVCAGEADFRDE